MAFLNYISFVADHSVEAKVKIVIIGQDNLLRVTLNNPTAAIDKSNVRPPGKCGTSSIHPPLYTLNFEHHT